MTNATNLNLQQLAKEFESGKISESQWLTAVNKYQATHPSSVQSAANSVANDVTAPFKTAASITNFLTSGKNWIRMLEVVAGAILIVMGLHQLTGAGSTVVNVAKTAGKVAAV